MKTATQTTLPNNEVAAQLGISVSTLRKYAAIIEEVTRQADFYQKDQRKNRIYSAENIQQFQELKQLKESSHLTLKQAATNLFGTTEVAANDEQLLTVVAQLTTKIEVQAAQISALTKRVSSLEEQGKVSSEVTLPSKKDFDDDIIDDLPSDEEVLQAQAELVQQTTDFRSEVLSKALENQESGKVSAPRTLADMQLEQKSHWWEKFK